MVVNKVSEVSFVMVFIIKLPINLILRYSVLVKWAKTNFAFRHFKNRNMEQKPLLPNCCCKGMEALHSEGDLQTCWQAIICDGTQDWQRQAQICSNCWRQRCRSRWEVTRKCKQNSFQHSKNIIWPEHQQGFSSSRIAKENLENKLTSKSSGATAEWRNSEKWLCDAASPKSAWQQSIFFTEEYRTFIWTRTHSAEESCLDSWSQDRDVRCSQSIDLWEVVCNSLCGYQSVSVWH